MILLDEQICEHSDLSRYMCLCIHGYIRSDWIEDAVHGGELEFGRIVMRWRRSNYPALLRLLS